MKKALLLGMLLVVLGAGSALATQLGTATPLAEKGSWSVGPGLFYYQGELEDEAKLEQTQLYAQLSYGLTDNFDIYLQGGAADLAIGDTGTSISGSYQPFGVVGFHAQLTDSTPFSLGLVAQGSYFSNYSDDIGTLEIEINQTYEVQGGLAIQLEWEGAYLYGGPMAYLRSSDVKITDGTDIYESTVEENSNIGGFFGLHWPLENGMNIEIEGQYKTKFSAGAAVHFSF